MRENASRSHRLEIRALIGSLLLGGLLLFGFQHHLRSARAFAAEPAGQPAAAAAAPETPKGVAWQEITLDEALDQAAKKKTMVMLDFWARHCGQCGQMSIDLWETPAGAKLAEGLIPIKIDSTTPEGRAAADRYPLTGLPCVIFIQPDGTELDRVEGYTNREEFLRLSQPMRDGLDALPGMEQQLKSHPDSLQLLLGVLDKYLFRRRMAEAESTYAHILRVDPLDRMTYTERAMGKMARYQELVLHDEAASAKTYMDLVDKFPAASYSGGAVDGAQVALMNLGRGQEWLDWICKVLEKNPNQGYLNRISAQVGLRGGFRSPCLAKAARASRSAFPGKEAWWDSIAVVLEGGTTPPK
jgi:hypothetical protein